MRLWMTLLLAGVLTGGNVALFIATAHQFMEAQALYEDARVERLSATAQHEAADAQRHAAEQQRAVVEAVAAHTHDWMETALAAHAVTNGKRCGHE